MEEALVGLIAVSVGAINPAAAAAASSSCCSFNVLFLGADPGFVPPTSLAISMMLPSLLFLRCPFHDDDLLLLIFFRINVDFL
jgi:hypothetical protein